MGNYRIVIDAVGPHGCTPSRPVQAQEPLAAPCGHPSCPDCAARAFVKSLGSQVVAATLEHWPGQPEAVLDDIKNAVRLQHSFHPRKA